MLKLLLPAVIFLSGCAAHVPEQIVEKPTAPQTISKVELYKNPDGSFSFSALYWATPRGVAEHNWNAVLGGTVIEVKNESQILGGDFDRKFVSGAIKVEKIFLNLPDSSEIKINSIVRSEGFDGLKRGDKVIIFITGEYEGAYVRTEIEGTNSKIGFKVEDWNDPIVSALEKVAPCEKIGIGGIDGFPEDFKAKFHDCYSERNKMILDDPQISDVWKKNDPSGINYLKEIRELGSENK